MGVIRLGRNSHYRVASYDESAMTARNLVNGRASDRSIINGQRSEEKSTIGSDCKQPKQTKSRYATHQHQTKNVQQKLHFDGDQPAIVTNRSDERTKSDTARVHSCRLLERSHSNTDKPVSSGKEISTDPENKHLSCTALKLCTICNRFYGTVSIGIHTKACQRAQDTRSRQVAARQLWEEKLTRRPTHPPGTICHICGRRYTSASWSMHVRRCRKQWMVWNSMLPRKERHKTLPVTPKPSESEIMQRIEEARSNGLSHYIREDAVDDIMFEASVKNRLPLELIH
ncbi:Zinc finger protein [Paragonimus skrjabini miyazakii]|uniref:Zinc finger protein n=1 Tax=Paragonimus skrjabini miyazakii TaxID=59628 RepID=A0A8S9YLM0_9TREM|nr:Zinc finger protein [Paragonimus skrjabini miyazakii]